MHHQKAFQSRARGFSWFATNLLRLVGLLVVSYSIPASLAAEHTTNTASKISQISLPVIVDFSAIEKAANQEIPKEFDSDTSEEVYGVLIDNLRGKRGDFSVGCDEGKISITAKVKGKFDLSKMVLSRRVGLGSVELVMNAGMHVRPVVTKNWALELNATPFCEVQTIKFEGLPVSSIPQLGEWLKKEACDVIRGQLADQVEDLEQEIGKDESLRRSLETEIRNLTEGISFGADRQLWLQVLPLSLSQPELGCDSRHMIFRVGMQAEVKASLTKPKAKSWRGLPAPVAMPERDDLVVNLTVQGERKSWEELLRAAVVGQDMELSEATKMRITDCTTRS